MHILDEFQHVLAVDELGYLDVRTLVSENLRYWATVTLAPGQRRQADYVLVEVGDEIEVADDEAGVVHFEKHVFTPIPRFREGRL